MSGRVTFHGDPDNLTWALFDFPAEVHAVPGKFRVGVRPDWPTAHITDRACSCRPTLLWDSDFAPRPLIEHHDVRPKPTVQ